MNRVAIASATAFLLAQLLDIVVFNQFWGGSPWSARLGSTLAGSTVDTAIFFSIAFAAPFNGFSAGAAEEVIWAQGVVPFLNTGPLVPLWVSLAVADWGLKLIIAPVALVPFRIIVGRMVSRTA